MRLCRHVFSKDDLNNYYVQRLQIAVHEIDSHQFRPMANEDRRSLSAVLQVDFAVCRSQRALISERRGKLRIPIDAKERPKRATKPIMMMTSSPMGGFDPPFTPVDPGTLNGDGKSILDVAMNLGSILFATAETDPQKGNDKSGAISMGMKTPRKRWLDMGKCYCS